MAGDIKAVSTSFCSALYQDVVHAGQVGGYVEEYDGLTFSTVRNAGHMVPYTQPERAFHLFSHWIHGKEL